MLFLLSSFSFLMIPPPPPSTLFPYTTLFRSVSFFDRHGDAVPVQDPVGRERRQGVPRRDNADQVERVGAAQRDKRAARLLAPHRAEQPDRFGKRVLLARKPADEAPAADLPPRP